MNSQHIDISHSQFDLRYNTFAEHMRQKYTGDDDGANRWRWNLHVNDDASAILGYAKETLENVYGKAQWYETFGSDYRLSIIILWDKLMVGVTSTDKVGSICTKVEIMGYNTASEPSETAVIDALVATGRFNRNRSLDNKVKVTFAFAERGDVRYSDRTFTSEPLQSIAGNYSPQVVNQVQTVVSELNELEKGIVIIHGVPGTGKTHLIRSMLSDCTQRTPVVCNPPLEFLNNMGMLNSVMTNYDSSLIILEDLGDVLSKSAPRRPCGRVYQPAQCD